MKNLGRSLGWLTAALLVTANGGAAVLRVVPWPLTTSPHDRIESRNVQVETTLTFAQWTRRVQEQNPQLLEDISIQPVASVRMDVVGEEEPEATLQEVVHRAQVEAAWAGANFISLETRGMGAHNGITAARFMAYRMEYHQKLVEPETLASLTAAPAPSLALARTLVRQEPRWTARPSSEANPPQHQDLLRLLGHLKEGTRVRFEMDNGTTVQGTFSGLDEENRVWVRPQGVAGLLADRAFYPRDIQIVSWVDTPPDMPTMASRF